MSAKVEQGVGAGLRNEAYYERLNEFTLIFSSLKQDKQGSNLRIYSRLNHFIEQVLPESTYYNKDNQVQKKPYRDDYNYSDAYDHLLLTLELNSTSIAALYADFEHCFTQPSREMSASEALKNMENLERLLDLLYDSEHDVLKVLHEKLRASIEPCDVLKIEQAINELITPGQKNNENILQKQSPNWEQINSLYKPETMTSRATVREYSFYRNSNLPRELRFGVQGSRHQGVMRVSSLFKSWLELKKNKLIRSNSMQYPSTIQHVYINNLSLGGNEFEDNEEKELTRELHDLELRHDNLAVITLPADKGLTDESLLNSEAKVNKDKAQSDLINRVVRKSILDFKDVRVFYISPEIKKMIYRKSENENQNEAEIRVVTELVTKSFCTFGLGTREIISEVQLQAVMFHFFKFELPRHILAVIKPDTFNVSCNNAIDRGSIFSAYYNLMNSIELHHKNSEHPVMDKDEFIHILHAASILVKGRGMNRCVRLIWNVIDAYLENPDNEKKVRKCELKWLLSWRNENVPKERIISFVERKSLGGVLEINLLDFQVKRLMLEYNLNSKETKEMALFCNKLDSSDKKRVFNALSDGCTYVLREENLKDNFTSEPLQKKIYAYRKHKTIIEALETLSSETRFQALGLYSEGDYELLNELLLQDTLKLIPEKFKEKADFLFRNKKYEELYRLISKVETNDKFQFSLGLTNRELALEYLSDKPIPIPNQGEKKALLDDAIVFTEESIKLKNAGISDMKFSNVYRLVLLAHGLIQDMLGAKNIAQLGNRIERIVKVVHSIKSDEIIWKRVGIFLNPFISSLAVCLGLHLRSVLKEMGNAQEDCDKFKLATVTPLKKDDRKNESPKL